MMVMLAESWLATSEDVDLLRVQGQLGVLAGRSTLVDLQHQAGVFVESTTSDTIAQRKRVIIHQRRGYLGEWAIADNIDLLVLLLNFRIVRRKVKLLEIDALERSDGVDEHPTSDTLP
jgi:hypothetical protein